MKTSSTMPIVNEYDYKGFHIVVTFNQDDAFGNGSYIATAYDKENNPVKFSYAVKGIEDVDVKIKTKIDIL